MSSIGVLAWGGCALAFVSGLGLFVLRTTESGFGYVNLPRLLYFLWCMICVMVFCVFDMKFAAIAGILFAAAVGVLALMGDEPEALTRRKDIEERLEGCRRALKENPDNPASLELIGDVYSTLEEKKWALSYWRKAQDILPQTKLREKIDKLLKPVPVFHHWGYPCSRELRACPECQRVASRLDYACSRCGEAFFPDRASWLATRYNRLCDSTGAAAAVESGIVFLPILYLCDPLAYAAVWLVWIGARRPGPAGGM